MDMEEGLAKGNLSFRLSGKKLKGDFSLVRFKRSNTGKEWLLIKKKDSLVR